MDRFTQTGGRTLAVIALASLMAVAACNEANGTEPWPGVYPAEAEIDRPKGGKRDGGAMLDAGVDDDASAPDADGAASDAEDADGSEASDAGDADGSEASDASDEDAAAPQVSTDADVADGA
jgi:hypothetical protein